MRRIARARALLFVAALVLVTGGLSYKPILRGAGSLLVAADPGISAHVDVVVVGLDTGTAGVLEAADLAVTGSSKKVAIFADPPSIADRELTRRGVAFEEPAAASVRQLNALEVSNVEVIPRSVEGSTDAARILPSWLVERGFHSAILVTTSDHSRRVQRAVRRAIKGQDVQVFVRVAKFSSFDPDHWWSSRSGLRTGITELQKLFLDVLRHPIS